MKRLLDWIRIELSVKFLNLALRLSPYPESLHLGGIVRPYINGLIRRTEADVESINREIA